MSDACLSPLFTWRSAVSSADGPEGSTTRHILLALSLYMNQKGGSCFPSLSTLARETGYAKETVSRHLTKAHEAGWIDKRPKTDKKGRRIGTDYYAKVPRGALTDDQPRLTEDQEGVDRGSTKYDNRERNKQSARDDGFSPPDVERVIEYGEAQAGVCEEECRRFWNHYDAVDWFDPQQRRITNWKSKLANWRARKGSFTRGDGAASHSDFEVNTKDWS